MKMSPPKTYENPVLKYLMPISIKFHYFVFNIHNKDDYTTPLYICRIQKR